MSEAPPPGEVDAADTGTTLGWLGFWGVFPMEGYWRGGEAGKQESILGCE